MLTESFNFFLLGTIALQYLWSLVLFNYNICKFLAHVTNLSWLLMDLADKLVRILWVTRILALYTNYAFTAELRRVVLISIDQGIAVCTSRLFVLVAVHLIIIKI